VAIALVIIAIALFDACHLVATAITHVIAI
jgi:hypothetical protein